MESQMTHMDMTLFYWIMGVVGAIMLLLISALVFFIKRIIGNIDRIEVKVTDFNTSMKVQSYTNVGLLEKIEEIWEEIKNIYKKHEIEISKNSERHSTTEKQLIEINKVLVAMVNRHEQNHGERINVIG